MDIIESKDEQFDTNFIKFLKDGIETRTEYITTSPLERDDYVQKVGELNTYKDVLDRYIRLLKIYNEREH